MKELSKNEYFEINGGSFAMDAGWFLGHVVSGAFLTPAGCYGAMCDYYLLYA